MIDPKEQNRANRRDKKRKKSRYGMVINYAGRKLAEILANNKRKKDV